MQSTKAQHRIQANQRREKPAPAPDPGQAYFQNKSAEFVNSADVELYVGGKILPAHSQYLASECRFWAKAIHHGTKTQASGRLLFTDQEQEVLRGIDSANLERCLGQVYTSCSQPIASATDAYELFLLAKRFDCQKLKAACFSYPEHSAGSFLQASINDQNSVLKWLLFAEKYKFPALQAACITFTAQNFSSIDSDQRLKQMHINTGVEVMRDIQKFHEQQRHAPPKRRRRTKSPVYAETSE